MNLHTTIGRAAHIGRSGILAAATLLLLPGLALAQAPVAVPVADTQVKVGAGLYEIVVNEATDSVLVASTGNDDPKIYELDAATLAEKRTIELEDGAFGLGINQQTQMLYTTNTRAGSVSVIDLKAGRVVATITEEGNPSAHVFRALVDESANKVYVSVVAAPSKVWIIDGRSNTLEHVIEGVTARSTGLALDREGNRLFTAGQGASEIAEIDLASRQVVRTFPSGGERPTQMIYEPATGRLFVTHQGTNNVVAIDTKTGEVVKAIETDEVALGIAFDPRADLLYVGNRMGGNVTVIDASSYEVVTTIEAGTHPNTLALDSRDGTVFLTNKARRVGRGAAAAPPQPHEGGDTVTRIVGPQAR